MSTELLLLGVQKDSVTYAWGSGQQGRLDNNENFFNFVKSPALIGDKNFSSIVCNGTTFLGLSGNSLWGWGDWASGSLATGGGSSPVQISGSWSSFSFFTNHVLAIKTDGTLWAWGNNSYGQLGVNDKISRSSPVQVGSNTWLAVAAGNTFSIALRSDNTVWTFGLDNNFQLGQGLTFIGEHRSSPVQIAGGGTYINVFAGPSTGYAVRTGGTLWGWGQNSSAILATGIPASTTRQSAPVQISSSTTWSKVSCDGNSVLAIKNNELFAWGSNSSGQLGTGDLTSYSSPVQIAGSWLDATVSLTSFAINSSNQLYGWGLIWSTPSFGINLYPGPTSPVLINNSLSWSKITGSPGFNKATSFASTTEPVTANLYGWGEIVDISSNSSNSNALLYNKKTEWRSSPVQITSQKNLFSNFFTNKNMTAYTLQDGAFNYNHAMGITKTNQVYGFGWNRYGQLGDGTTIPRSSPVLVSSESHTQVALGEQWTIFLRSNKTLWAAGDNSVGQLGINSLSSASSPTQIGSNANWISVAAGYSASFAITELNYLYAWGYNNFGIFGTGSGDVGARRSSPVFVGTDYSSVYAAANTVFVIKTNGTLWTAGDNTNQVLGYGTTPSFSSTLFQVSGTYTYPWIKIAPADDHVLALNSAGDLYAWGRNSSGQLGLNSNTGPVSSQFYNIPQFVSTGVSDIGVGRNISFIIKNGILYGFGYNGRGALGLNGGNEYYSSPVQIGSFSGWTNIAPSADGAAILGIATPQ